MSTALQGWHRQKDPMSPDIVSPDQVSAWSAFWSNLGSTLIGLGTAGITTIMWYFTKRHIESLDKLTERLGTLAEDVSAIRADNAAMRSHQATLEARLQTIERVHMDDNK